MVQMTRAQYEATYGVAPVFPATSTIDTTPAPIRMTRAEYQKTYGTTPEGKTINNPIQNVIDRKPAFPANTNTGNPLGNIGRTFANIPSSGINLARMLVADPIENMVKSDMALVDIYKNRGPIKGTMDIAGGIADTIGSAGSLYKKVGEVAYEGLEKGYNALLDNPQEAIGEATEYLSKLGIEDPLLIPSLLYGGGQVGKKDIISKLASPVTQGADTSIPNVVNKTKEASLKATEGIRKAQQEADIAKTADEIYAVEQNYAKGRKANIYATDGGVGSRKRIASSGVLNGAVNSDGLILTKTPGGAVDKYRAQTVDGFEDVVKKGLQREGAVANLKEVERALVLEVNKSGIEGADLIAALSGIKREIQGLQKRADQSNNILLDKIHDAKISTTRNIDYMTPPETKTYRKAVARAYKTLIEKKSRLNVAQVNKELGKYYKDIERLEALDGRRVKGGKLGKYTAQITGNIAGGIAGGMVGGTTGAALGTVLGGEVAAGIRGAEMAGAFGRVSENLLPPSQILKDAKLAADAPKVKDLRVPDKAVGARKGVPKTKEILELEGQIAKNVKAQEKAIKAKDFTLVAKLKEVYEFLVEALRDAVRVLTEKGPPHRGFIRVGGESKGEVSSRPKSSKQSPSPDTTTKTPKSQDSFEGFTDLSTKLLEKLKGRTTVSRQFIEDLSNSPDLKQAERDLIRRVLGEDGEVLYHGGAKIDQVDTGKSNFSETFYATDDPNYAKSFGGKDSVVNKMRLSPDANLIDLRKPTDAQMSEIQTAIEKEVAKPAKYGESFSFYPYSTKQVLDGIRAGKAHFAELPQIKDILKKLGYDGQITAEVPYAKNVGVWNKDKIAPVSDQISVPDFANRVKSELLPLNTGAVEYPRYENINLSEDLRGPVAGYQERVYESPVSTSAGGVHFSNTGIKKEGGIYQPKNYFAHTRIEDLPDNTTRRVIEAQSDLFQKGRLEGEFTDESQRFEDLFYEEIKRRGLPYGKTTPEQNKEVADFVNAKIPKEKAQLEPYRNTWWERVIREEVKRAAKDGKTKLQFPTGETAMKIEGLGANSDNWVSVTNGGRINNFDQLKVGEQVGRAGEQEAWIITDVLGDGKFKAVQKDNHFTASEYLDNEGTDLTKMTPEELAKIDVNRLSDGTYSINSFEEQFDISGKVDTENPIYKFYEKNVQKYLTNKYGGKVITDPQGVKWVEIDVKPEFKGLPVEAFGVAGGVGLASNE